MTVEVNTQFVLITNIILFIFGLVLILVSVPLNSKSELSDEELRQQEAAAVVKFVVFHNIWDHLTSVEFQVASTNQTVLIEAMDSAANIKISSVDTVTAFARSNITTDTLSLSFTINESVFANIQNVYFTSSGVVFDNGWIPYDTYKGQFSIDFEFTPGAQIYSFSEGLVQPYLFINDLTSLPNNVDSVNGTGKTWAGWTGLGLTPKEFGFNPIIFPSQSVSRYIQNATDDAWSLCCISDTPGIEGNCAASGVLDSVPSCV